MENDTENQFFSLNTRRTKYTKYHFIKKKKSKWTSYLNGTL